MSEPQNQNPNQNQSQILDPSASSLVRGLALKEPHASWIYLGVKDSIVSTEDYSSLLDNDLLLVGERAYGTIKLKDHSTITVNEFNELLESHRITDSERKLWGKSNNKWIYGPFYKYSFEFKPFDTPRLYEKPKMDKSIINNVILKEEIEDDFIYKPHGPWGEGFKECISWVKRNKPSISNPQAWCAEVYHRQQGNKKKEEEMEKEGTPKTDAERAMAHFNISPEEWEKLSPEKKREYIERLPERGQKVSKDDVLPFYCEPPQAIIIKNYIEERPSGFYLVRKINDYVDKELKFNKNVFTYEEIINMSFVKELLEENDE